LILASGVASDNRVAAGDTSFMRIVICDHSGHAFPVELSRSLAARGHTVLHLHCAEFQTPKGSLVKLAKDPPGFDVEGLQLGRPFDKQRFLRRRSLEAKFGTLAAARVASFHPDVVVGCTMPLDAQNKLQRFCRAQGIPFVFWIQDVYSVAIRHYVSAKLGIVGRAIGWYYARLEGKLLCASEAIIAISEGFLAALAEWGVDLHRVQVIPNWAPLSEIHPAAKNNDWARHYELQDKLVALYTGTLGLKHDPALLRDLARACKPAGIEVVVVSEGAGVDWLAEQKRALGLDNLLLLPFQPMARYAEVLGAGDILLAMIGAEAAGFSVPSKILSYLAAGKPVVAAIASENDAARTIHDAQAGIIVAPGDLAGFVAAVQALAVDKSRRETLARNARAFAESRFDIDAITDRFERVFASLSPVRGEPIERIPVELAHQDRSR
jgi:colanic acid biosynthesis glycosyl transferase WcaI